MNSAIKIPLNSQVAFPISSTPNRGFPKGSFRAMTALVRDCGASAQEVINRCANTAIFEDGVSEILERISNKSNMSSLGSIKASTRQFRQIQFDLKQMSNHLLQIIHSENNPNLLRAIRAIDQTVMEAMRRLHEGSENIVRYQQVSEAELSEAELFEEELIVQKTPPPKIQTRLEPLNRSAPVIPSAAESSSNTFSMLNEDVTLMIAAFLDLGSILALEASSRKLSNNTLRSFFWESKANELAKLVEEELKKISKTGNLKPSNRLTAIRRQVSSLDLSECCGSPELIKFIVTQFPNLEKIKIGENAWFNPACLKDLTALGKLRHLDISKSKLIDNNSLKNLPAFKNIETLNLSFCYLVNDDGLQCLAALDNLRDLNLYGCKSITGATIQCLRSLTKLETLSFRDCILLTDADLLPLLFLKKLRSLDLGNCKLISQIGLRCLKFLTQLQTLSINGTNFGDLTPEDLSGFQRLKTLSLQGCDLITDEDLGLLASLIGKLENLDLESCNGITNKGVKLLVQAKYLRALNLSYCEKVDGKILKDLSVLKNLEILELEMWRGATGDDAIHLNAFTKLHTLRITHCTDITASGTYPLSNLKELRVLSLADCRTLNDKTLESLAPLEKMEELTIQSRGITSKGIKSLTNLRRLDTLSLENCDNIDDEALKHLVSFEHLEVLVISGCTKITGEALDELRPLRKLQSLSVTGCDLISKLDCDRLNAMLPHLKIY